MATIIVIRSGSTEYDRQGRIQGTLDIPLNDQGKQEVAAALESLSNLNIGCLYAAPGEASEQTGREIAQALKVSLKTVDKLRNLNHGLWQGMLVSDVRSKQPKVYRQWQERPETICPPEGEMLSSARQRVKEVLIKIAKKHKEGTVGLIVPEPLASIVCSVAGDANLGDLWKANQRGTWEMISITPGANAVNI